jgi:hypothetical protein
MFIRISLIIILPIAEHPSAFETVTVYAPGALIVREGLNAPVDHW